jgi:hypothetical protein
MTIYKPAELCHNAGETIQKSDLLITVSSFGEGLRRVPLTTPAEAVFNAGSGRTDSHATEVQLEFYKNVPGCLTLSALRIYNNFIGTLFAARQPASGLPAIAKTTICRRCPWITKIIIRF